jgi:hypothetical protein
VGTVVTVDFLTSTWPVSATLENQTAYWLRVFRTS